MLVIGRRKDESIMIGDDIKIVVVKIEGDKVRIGIEAPKYVPVHRKEIWDLIKSGSQKRETETKEN